MVKRFILLATFALSVAFVFAQDVILKKDGSEINAKVLEITEQQVKYKDFDFQDGPTRNINISDVFMITYENGQREVFNKPISAPTTPENEVFDKQTSPSPPITVQPSVQNNDGEVYFNGWGTLKYRSNNKKVTNMEDLFYNMPDAAKMYRSGKTLRTVGGIVVGTGFLIMFYGAIDYWMDYTANHYGDTNYSLFKSAIFWTGFGVASGGVIVSRIGWSKQNAAINLYNTTVRRQQTSNVSMNFGITQNGCIGLTLNF